jgi:hypothetical protein
MHFFSFSMAMKMTLRKTNPTVGAVENLKLRMETQKEEQSSGSPSKGGDSGLSAGATAGITIGVTLSIGIMFIAIFVAVRRRRNPPLPVNGSGGYQTFNNS